MQFKPAPRRRIAESVVPMINVVFLLLIFFMMTARIAPAPPFDLTLPVSPSDNALDEDMTLYVSADGGVGFRGGLDGAAWITLAGVEADQRLTIRADADLPTPKIAAVLARLAGMGFSSIDLALRGS